VVIYSSRGAESTTMSREGVSTLSAGAGLPRFSGGLVRDDSLYGFSPGASLVA